MGFWIFKRKNKEPDQVIELNRDVALSEAASTLGRAGDIASKKQDMDNLLQVAAGWMQLSHRLDPTDYDTVDSKPEPTQIPMGFSPPRPDVTKTPEAPNPDVED